MVALRPVVGAAITPNLRVRPMTWTDERVETLKSMWAEGKSASQIAKELGGITRNAVIGKVHRLGLSNRIGGPGGADDPEAALYDAEDADHAAEAPGTDDGDASTPLEERDLVDEPQLAAMPDTVAQLHPNPGGRPKPSSVAPAVQPPLAPAGPSEISPEALANLAEVERKSKRLTLMQLTERTCKWPVGDPATDDFWFCGLPATAGKPYCEAHVAVAFQPMSSRRDRRGGR
jgi:GcrA cell cycle regulator